MELLDEIQKELFRLASKHYDNYILAVVDKDGTMCTIYKNDSAALDLAKKIMQEVKIGLRDSK